MNKDDAKKILDSFQDLMNEGQVTTDKVKQVGKSFILNGPGPIPCPECDSMTLIMMGCHCTVEGYHGDKHKGTWIACPGCGYCSNRIVIVQKEMKCKSPEKKEESKSDSGTTPDSLH